MAESLAPIAPTVLDATRAFDAQLEHAAHQLTALEAAHRAGDHHASGIAASEIRAALRRAEQAAAQVRAASPERAATLDHRLAAVREAARSELELAFTPSPAALREITGGSERVQWNREVAAWRAARGFAELHSVPGAGANTAGPQPANPASPVHAAAPEGFAGAGRLAHLNLIGTRGGATSPGAALQRQAAAAAPADPWEHMFGQASTPVDKLGRVQAPRGRTLLQRPSPDAPPNMAAPLPFDARVMVVRRTTQSTASDRWCYIAAPEHGAAGFCEERYLAIDPPEPRARLHRVGSGERLGKIARDAYGAHMAAGNDERLYVQGLYEANKGRAGVKLTPVQLSASETWHRRAAEEETLEIYRGVQVLEGMSLWIPSNDFVQRLKASGAITSGSSELSKAWRAAAELVDDAIEAVKYAAGFIVGLLEGAWSAIVDLFKGAAELIEAVATMLYHLVTGNPGRIKDMLMTWVDKMKSAWEHRGQIADQFMKKWNAPSGWDRGRFHGEVLGWVVMTVLIIVVTAGESAAASAGGLAARFPQVVKLLKTVDAVGDVTTYLGGAIKGVEAAGKLPQAAADVVKGKLGKPSKPAPGNAGSPSRSLDSVDDVEKRASDGGGASPVQRTTVRPGEGAWETTARQGERSSAETIEHGTVRMEDHPGFDALLKEASSKGFAIKYGKDAHVELVHVIDEGGNLLEIRRELHLVQGMRYLDLEHEIGHIRQLDRFGSTPPPTNKVLRRNGTEVEAKGNLASGKLTAKMNSTVEYHNRLQEYIRLAERKVARSVLDEHAVGVDRWRINAEVDGLGRGGSLDTWAKQYFHDIPALEARCRELGLVLNAKTSRWSP